MDILIISDTPQKWIPCIPILEQAGGAVSTVPAMPEALAYIRNTPPVLAILDTATDAKTIRQHIIDILMINASVHTAVTSEMPEEVFHDTMEGLGILMSLPPVPGQGDMLVLLDRLKRVC